MKLPHPHCALEVPLESPQQVQVHQGGFVMFRPTVPQLLSIEHICQKKKLKTKSKLKLLRKLDQAFKWFCRKAIDEMGFLEATFQFLDLR
jgi:hypothetical protein